MAEEEVPEQAPAGQGITRRNVLKAGLVLGAAQVLAACGGKTTATTGPSTSASASGSKKSPSGKPINLGFIALTDCASVVMAKELGYFADRGLNVNVVKQTSWAGTRDNLLSGQIDGAHCLSAMPISLAAGIGGKPDQVLKIAMIINNNGQSITLKKELAAAGYDNLKTEKSVLTAQQALKLAMTFPGGTHDTWLRYWLMAAGVPTAGIQIVTIPPPQMVANMTAHNMDGFSVGEPWNAKAVSDGIGFTAINSQDIWDNHPEKALVVNPAFAESRKDELKQVMGAVLQASKWLDDQGNRASAAQTIGVPAYVGAEPAAIRGRMLGQYDLGAGLGSKTYNGDYMRFYRDGNVNFPRHSYVMWFLAQYQRFGLLKTASDYKAVANNLILSDLYQEVAQAEKIPVPNDDLAPISTQLDGATFDPANPQAEAKRV